MHLGQTDMPISVARNLLPQGTIIGVTCNTPEHVRKAVQDGADYVGLGPVWGTKTKNVKHPILGPRGIARVLLSELEGTHVKSVAIGILDPSVCAENARILIEVLCSRYQIDQCSTLFARVRYAGRSFS